MAAMPIISLRVKQETLDRVTRDLAGIKHGVRTAMASAIKDVLKKSKTRLSKKIREKINLKKNQIDPNITIANPTKSMLMGTLWIKGKRKPLIAFGAKWKPGQSVGASYMISKDEGRKRMPGAFITSVIASKGEDQTNLSNKNRLLRQWLTGEGGNVSEHTGVFKRRGDKRLPITQKYGISPVGVFQNAPGFEQQEIAELEKDLDERIMSKVDWLISKRDAQAAAVSGSIGPDDQTGGAA